VARRLNDLGFDTEHPVFKGATGKALVNLGVPFGDDVEAHGPLRVGRARPATVTGCSCAPAGPDARGLDARGAALHDAGRTSSRSARSSLVAAAPRRGPLQLSLPSLACLA
jgi:hypothetical protein